MPVPVDVDAQTLQPSVEHLERSITPRTRAILVAHLFGTHVDMGPIIELARQHDLLVIEDCAQAFVGREYAGHPDSNCALFSFGPIKTATALGRGGGSRARCGTSFADDRVCSTPTRCKLAGPISSGWRNMRRSDCSCKPFNYGLMVRTLKLLGIDYDRALGNAAHSFGCKRFLFANPPAAVHAVAADAPAAD